MVAWNHWYCKENDLAARTRWRSFDSSRRRAVSCSPCFSLLWNHGFKLLASDAQSVLVVLDPDRNPSRCDHCFGCLYRPWSGPLLLGNSYCWKGVMSTTGDVRNWKGQGGSAIQRFVRSVGLTMLSHRSDWDWVKAKSEQGRLLSGCTEWCVTVVGVLQNCSCSRRSGARKSRTKTRCA